MGTLLQDSRILARRSGCFFAYGMGWKRRLVRSVPVGTLWKTLFLGAAAMGSRTSRLKDASHFHAVIWLPSVIAGMFIVKSGYSFPLVMFVVPAAAAGEGQLGRDAPTLA